MLRLISNSIVRTGKRLPTAPRYLIRKYSLAVEQTKEKADTSNNNSNDNSEKKEEKENNILYNMAIGFGITVGALNIYNIIEEKTPTGVLIFDDYLINPEKLDDFIKYYYICKKISFQSEKKYIIGLLTTAVKYDNNLLIIDFLIQDLYRIIPLASRIEHLQSLLSTVMKYCNTSYMDYLINEIYEISQLISPLNLRILF